MEKLRTQIQKTKQTHTLLLCFAIAVLFIFFLFISDAVNSFGFSPNAARIVKEALRSVFVIGIVYFLGEQFIFSKSGTAFFKGLAVGAFVLSYQIFSLIVFFSKHPHETPVPQIAVYAVFCLMIGITEETCFRGIVTNLLAQRYVRNRISLYLTALLSGAIFGILHFTNILDGASPSGTFLQVIHAFGMGCFFSAVYLRTGNIWVVVSIHALQDFLAMNVTGITYAAAVSGRSLLQGAGVIFFLIPAFFLLRKSKSAEIIQRYEELAPKTESTLGESRLLQAKER